MEGTCTPRSDKLRPDAKSTDILLGKESFSLSSMTPRTIYDKVQMSMTDWIRFEVEQELVNEKCTHPISGNEIYGAFQLRGKRKILYPYVKQRQMSATHLVLKNHPNIIRALGYGLNVDGSIRRHTYCLSMNPPTMMVAPTSIEEDKKSKHVSICLSETICAAGEVLITKLGSQWAPNGTTIVPDAVLGVSEVSGSMKAKKAQDMDAEDVEGTFGEQEKLVDESSELLLSQYTIIFDDSSGTFTPSIENAKDVAQVIVAATGQNAIGLDMRFLKEAANRVLDGSGREGDVQLAKTYCRINMNVVQTTDICLKECNMLTYTSSCSKSIKEEDCISTCTKDGVGGGTQCVWLDRHIKQRDGERCVPGISLASKKSWECKSNSQCPFDDRSSYYNCTEEFDGGSLCLGNISNEPTGDDLLATGSLHGFLRIYRPTRTGSIEDLLLEENLESPILQLEVGYFSSKPNQGLCLAVLHPKHLRIFCLVPKGSSKKSGKNDDRNVLTKDYQPQIRTEGKSGALDMSKLSTKKKIRVQDNEEKAFTVGKGKSSSSSSSSASTANYYQLQKLYSHALGENDGFHFTSSTMVVGSFGGCQGKDHIAVLSMDGKLAFFSPNYVFTRCLDNCLVPGPMAYIPRTDSFVTVNSIFEVESYSYHSLASASSAKDELTLKRAKQSGAIKDSTLLTGGNSGRRKARPKWTRNIGESAIAICTARLASTMHPSVVILGEKTLFCLNENGLIQLQMRLEYPAACVTAFSISGGSVGRSREQGMGGEDNLLVVSTTGHMMVYAARSIDDFKENDRSSNSNTNQQLKSGKNASFAVEDKNNSWKNFQKSLHQAASFHSDEKAKDETKGKISEIPKKQIPTEDEILSAEAALAAGKVLTRQQKEVLSGGGLKNSSTKQIRMIWASKICPKIKLPVAVSCGVFEKYKGLVSILDEEGCACISYFGTTPSTSAIGVLSESKDLDYSSMDQEHRALLQTIRKSQGNACGISEPKAKVELRVQVPSLISFEDENDDILVNNLNRSESTFSKLDFTAAKAKGGTRKGSAVQVIVKLYISYTGSEDLKNVNLAIICPPNVVSTSKSIQIAKVSGGANPIIVPLVFRPCIELQATHLDTTVIAAYTSDDGGEPRTSRCDFMLPLCLNCHVAPPVNNSQCKFTLELNCEIPSLMEIFGEMLQQPELDGENRKQCIESASNIITFMYRNGRDCSVVTSNKKNTKVRVQSSSLDALLLVGAELTRRLKSFNSTIQITYNDPLPLQVLFARIDDHFTMRQRVKEQTKILENRAEQFRCVQKRLLVRYKDRNAPPLNSLDSLLKVTYEQLMAMGKEFKETQKDMSSASRLLSVTIRLFLLLAKYRFHMKNDDFVVLQATISPLIDDNEQQGWEERTDAAVVYLLKTVLAKNRKEGTVSTAAPITLMKKTSKLKKHITILCDRLSKGGKLVTISMKKKVNDAI
eukprot:g2572.t1